MLSLKVEGLDEMISNFNRCKREYELEMIDVFFLSAYRYIIERANQYIDNSGIGQATKEQIKSGWQKSKVTKSGNECKFIIKNTDDSAAFVEFGVGIVGKGQPHISAKVSGYEYDIGKTDEYGKWTFHESNKGELDIATEYITSKLPNDFYQTKGQPAVMYLYKACQDFVLVSKQKWEDVKRYYWR